MDGTGIKAPHCVAAQTMSLNDNFNFMGKELHVQTENIQSAKPFIRTHVFLGGRVIYSKINELPTESGEIYDFGEIRERKKAQNRNVIQKISEKQLEHQK